METSIISNLQEFKLTPIVVKLAIREGGGEFIGFCQRGFNLRDGGIYFEFDFFMGMGDRKVIPHYTLTVKIEDVLNTISRDDVKLTIVTYSETITIETLSATHVALCTALFERQQT